MNQKPSFKEDHISQIPALQLLINMGYKYLTPKDALEERNGKRSHVLLENILEKQLHKINTFSFKGRDYKFHPPAYRQAIQTLKDVQFDGLVRTNEKIYDLLTLGKSFEQTIGDETKSFTMKYIDFENPLNNEFHITEEFEVEKTASHQTRRPDIILFVNGIPLVVIECKSPDLKETLEKTAISQMLRNQHKEEIPVLFIFSQLVLAISKNEAKYATAGTPAKFWNVWKEDSDINNELLQMVNKPLRDDQKARLFSEKFNYVKHYFLEMEKDPRLITEQDKLLYCLCRPERLLEFMYKFTLYDGGEKKIARYKQYFAVNKTVERLNTFDNSGKRIGGVLWHTQGSGKSLTMVMLAKSIVLQPSILNPKILLVTDRVDLDDQIYKTFHNCGKEPVQAKTGKHLAELVSKSKYEIITTLVHKFESALSNKSISNDSKEIFVLVDESHRSQYGSLNVQMQKVLPNACYIGFTGTPLMKKDKNTADRFGGIIDTYTINEAVEDKAVVPLLYEGRHAEQEVTQNAIDTWFDKVSENLSDDQKVDLKKKFSSANQLNQAELKIKMIAYDISVHFKNTWQGTPFKGQLAAPSQPAAIKYKKYLDDFGMVSSDVLISGPDTREGYDDTYTGAKEDVLIFWKAAMEKYGTEDAYNKQLINAFKKSAYPEIIIVVDKLLTGFDAPKNTVLYLTKKLQGHSLLQAIARVNRLYEGKDFGYIIDYYGLLGALDQALTDYGVLAGFDENDIAGTLIDVMAEINKLPQKHSELWDIFKTLKNKQDEEEYEVCLGNEEIRKKFYDKLSSYTRTLDIALSTFKFVDATPEKTIKNYKTDLLFFQKLRTSVKKRYAESIDYKEYEGKVQKLIDTYVTSEKVTRITDLVNIFDKEKFDQEVNKIKGLRARADTIANRTKKSIYEKMEEDPAFYKKFSQLLEETIKAYREQRISEVDYLNQVKSIMNSVRNRTGDEMPEKLRTRDVAKAFFGIVNEAIKSEEIQSDLKELYADVAIKIDDIIRELKIVDWQNNSDVQNKMRNTIEDYLFDIKELHNLKITFDQIDLIMDESINVAKIRYGE
ncbi:type I restriction endonuclease subunit R [Candidatus Dependentiae bacterium]|nr:type I restriction endonuclease subunit R [Candidatus Dependentiae bacterium]